MNFKINTIRKFEIEHMFDDTDVCVKLFFEKVAVENLNFDELRDKLNLKKVAINKEEEGQVKEEGSYNAFLYMLRKSLIGWEGIVDQNGVVVPFNENNQIAVFEEVQKEVSLIRKIIVAYSGINEKNL